MQILRQAALCFLNVMIGLQDEEPVIGRLPVAFLGHLA